MTFPTVVFGSYEVGVGYTDGASIPTGGLGVFILPTKNVGLAPMDVGITYVDQFGVTKTTTVTTSIPATATAGTHFQMVLNSGDSGIRDVTAVSIIGGSIGDKFNLESWNEGLGRTPYSITKSTPDAIWIQSDPIKDWVGITKVFSSWGDFYNTIKTDMVQSGYPDTQFSLPIEIIEPNYATDVTDFGFMRPNTLVTKNGIAKKLRIDLVPGALYSYLNVNEQSTRLKWKWDPVFSQYEDTGFYKLTFDYDVQFNSTYFVFELLDSYGAVVWSKTATGTGTNQVVLFKSLSWELRLRCKANYTAPAITTDYAQVTDIRIERYKELGTVELNYAVDMPNISAYNAVDINTVVPVSTRAISQLAFSDNGNTWSNFIGPDNTIWTYFEGIGTKIAYPLPLGLTGYYYKWIIYLQSDGRDTPTLYDMTIYIKVNVIREPLQLEVRPPYPYLLPNPRMIPPISFIKLCPRTIPGYPAPPPGCIGGDYLPLPLSGYVYTQRKYSYIKACPRTTPGYPALTSECAEGDYLSDPLSGKQLIAKRFAILKTWLESVVGQVISGYVQNVNGDIIKNAFSMVLMSTTPTEVTPSGTSFVTNVNPDTGLYQAFLKKIIYDKRYVIIKIGVKNVALEGAGIPAFIDGSEKLEIPYNLQFACPIIDCDFNITRKL